MSEVQWVAGKVARLGIVLRAYIYHVDGLLVDTGPKTALKEYKPFFNNHQIKQIVLTHNHEDHSGNARYLQDKYQVPIYVHESQIEYAKQNGKYPFYRRLFWGPRKPFNPTPLPEIIETDHYKFKVIQTPGHSDDHISLYEEANGWLFSGDLYITQKPKLFLKFESIPKTIESLENLVNLDIEYLFCAHSGKISDGKEKLRGKLNYLKELKDQILDLHQQGITNVEIARRLFPNSSPMIFLSGGEFAYIHAVESIVNNK